jgi:hypothetical protein
VGSYADRDILPLFDLILQKLSVPNAERIYIRHASHRPLIEKFSTHARIDRWFSQIKEIVDFEEELANSSLSPEDPRLLILAAAAMREMSRSFNSWRVIPRISNGLESGDLDEPGQITAWAYGMANMGHRCPG